MIDKGFADKRNGKRHWGEALLLLFFLSFLSSNVHAQMPGAAPIRVSTETQVMHGKKYYVHIVEKGQTVYSIAKAYKVESYDAVTHVDIHFLHPGDTVWLPVRGQFATDSDALEAQKQESIRKQEEQHQQAAPQPSQPAAPAETRPVPTHGTVSSPEPIKVEAPEVKPIGKVLRMSLMMPLHLDQIDEISTSKFDVEQRGKRSYRQFEFIEFYEGIRMALDELSRQGVSVELNVVDVKDNSPETVERLFVTHRVAQSDFVVALLFRDAFDKAAQLAQQAGVYIVNPMATRSEICAENPYMVKIQPSLESQVRVMLDNMKFERPDGHLYIIHGANATSEKPVLDELKRQLAERGDIKYTLFNWNQNAKLTATLKSTPGCNVLSVYDHKMDQMRVYSISLLNRLSAFKTNSPTLYTISDWTRDFGDVDFSQLQLLGYHTFSSAWDMTNEVHVEFLKAFRDTYGSEPTSPLAATGYDLTMYIVTGLHGRHGGFWAAPSRSMPSLVHPLHFSRRQAGLENDQPQLFRMESLRLVPTR